MSIGFWQIVIVVLLLVLLFGRGKISDLMGDVAKGIKSFKKGMSEEEKEQEEEAKEESSPRVIEHTSVEPVATAGTGAKTPDKAKAPRKRKAS
jgi:sec-independent protein translocase protein TatA